MSTDKSIPCKSILVIQVTHDDHTDLPIAAKLLLTKLGWLQARKELARVELLKVCEYHLLVPCFTRHPPFQLPRLLSAL